MLPSTQRQKAYGAEVMKPICDEKQRPRGREKQGRGIRVLTSVLSPLPSKTDIRKPGKRGSPSSSQSQSKELKHTILYPAAPLGGSARMRVPPGHEEKGVKKEKTECEGAGGALNKKRGPSDTQTPLPPS